MAHESAQQVIDRLGGAVVVSGMCGVTLATVYRWTYPEARGGTGGLIPTKYHDALLEAASGGGIKLRRKDFYPAD